LGGGPPLGVRGIRSLGFSHRTHSPRRLPQFPPGNDVQWEKIARFFADSYFSQGRDQLNAVPSCCSLLPPRPLWGRGPSLWMTPQVPCGFLGIGSLLFVTEIGTAINKHA
jgi:hypothetical protein